MIEPRVHTLATMLGRLISLAAPLALAAHAAACGGNSTGDVTAAIDAGAAAVPDGAPAADAAGSPNGDDAAVVGAPSINADGYATLDAGGQVFAGYVSSFSGGTGTTIDLTYTTTALCASGSVAPNRDYQSYAGVILDIQQAPYTSGGNTGTAGSVPITGTSLTFSFSNSGGSPLEIELVNQNYNFWCYDLTGAASPIQIPLSRFNTSCWDGSGSPFASGTAIMGVQLVVSGATATATPFDFCFEGLTTE